MERDFEHIRSLIGKSIKKNKALSGKVAVWQGKRDVEFVLGKQIMRYIRKIEVEKDIIRIHTYQSILRQEVQSMENELLERINALSTEYHFRRILI